MASYAPLPRAPTKMPAGMRVRIAERSTTKKRSFAERTATCSENRPEESLTALHCKRSCTSLGGCLTRVPPFGRIGLFQAGADAVGDGLGVRVEEHAQMIAWHAVPFDAAVAQFAPLSVRVAAYPHADKLVACQQQIGLSPIGSRSVAVNGLRVGLKDVQDPFGQSIARAGRDELGASGIAAEIVELFHWIDHSHPR